jgi:fructose-bisphosphate aldolase class I
MKIWHGDTKNVAAAQKAFYERARLNSLASLGQYQVAMEKEKSVA